MTLDDPKLTLNVHYVLCCVTSFGGHTKNFFNKIDPHYQQQKCNPGIAVSSKVYADICWGSLKSGLQMRVGSLKMAIFASFARHIFRTFTCKPQLLYYTK